jgi:hypothetical protein
VVTRRLTVVACVACVAATAAGAARAARPPLTVKAYRAQANAICAKFNGYQLPTEGSMADQLSAMVAKGRTSLDKLRSLRPPQSLAKLHAGVIAADGRQLALLASLIPQLRAGKLTLVQVGARLHANGFGDQANALWKQIGAVDCVRY